MTNHPGRISKVWVSETEQRANKYRSCGGLLPFTGLTDYTSVSSWSTHDMAEFTAWKLHYTYVRPMYIGLTLNLVVTSAILLIPTCIQPKPHPIVGLWSNLYPSVRQPVTNHGLQVRRKLQYFIVFQI